MIESNFHMNKLETEQFKDQGYLVRESIFDREETTTIARICDEITGRAQHKDSNQCWKMGHYLFEVDADLEVVIKWEKDNPDVLLGLEPVAHLNPALHEWALDDRLKEPMADIIGCQTVGLYTEKLNVKRARFGGSIVTHQDHPYWVDVSDDVDMIATAVVFLDAAHAENGCIEVLPGSHRLGLQETKSETGFAANEIDESKIDLSGLIPLEVAAGSAVFFGPRLVHRSRHNASDEDRRAILFSYQPEGLKHSRAYINLRKLAP